jgi:hypothetical protein
MRRVLLSVTCLATMGMLFTAVPVLAQNPHFQYANSSINSKTFCYSVSFKEVGLGNSGATTANETLTCSSATFTAQCYTKSGNPVNGTTKRSGPSPISTSGTFPIRNGQTTGSLSACPPNPNSASFTGPGCTGSQQPRITSATYSGCQVCDQFGNCSPAADQSAP